MGYTLLVIFIIFVLTIVLNIKIVPQSQEYVIERLGVYYNTWKSGIHVLVPWFDKIAKKISLKEQVVDFAPQSVITKDNVTIIIDDIVFYSVFDSKKYAYNIEHPVFAIESLCATTLRNIIGDLELDSVLTSRDTINTEITLALEKACDEWGIKVNRVELKNIELPQEIKDSMEKQMKAERERRANILAAEGKKQSVILIAEGDKQSKVLNAEADKDAKILEAQADNQALILHADAVKKQKISEAAGEAEAIVTIKNAQAAGIKAINEANPSNQYTTIRSLEAFEKAADGQATKIIIPSNIQSLAGLTSVIKEVANK